MNDDSLLLIEETKENMNNTIQFFDRELQNPCRKIQPTNA